MQQNLCVLKSRSTEQQQPSGPFGPGQINQQNSALFRACLPLCHFLKDSCYLPAASWTLEQHKMHQLPPFPEQNRKKCLYTHSDDTVKCANVHKDPLPRSSSSDFSSRHTSASDLSVTVCLANKTRGKSQLSHVWQQKQQQLGLVSPRSDPNPAGSCSSG